MTLEPTRPRKYASRFERPSSVDPASRRDETFAFDPAAEWRPPDWFARVNLVLIETTDAVNIGGVVRVMANTGFTSLRLVNPRVFDAWDIVGIAHYTQHIIEQTTVHASLSEALADANFVVALTGKHQRAQRNRLPLAEAVSGIAERARAGARVALVLGREDTGLTNADLDLCHAVTTIPTNPAYPSLNLAQAALLVLYQLFQLAGGDEQPARLPRRSAPPADGRLLAYLFADMEQALDAIEFLKHGTRESKLRSLRAALYRAGLDAREAALLRAAFIEVRNFLHRRGILADVGPVGAEPPTTNP
jgi:TrmH family RNA methyltransferase